MSTVVFGLMLFSSITGASPFLSSFKAATIHCSDGPFKNRVLNYRLFCPLNRENARLPLIIWLHGNSNAGEDNERQLSNLEDIIFTDRESPSSYRFFLLAMQCPTDFPFWIGSATIGNSSGNCAMMRDMVDIVMCVTREICDQHLIDNERIVATGVCSGGEGAWELGSRYPNVLAAIAPISSAGTGSARPLRLLNLNIWAFHSTYDMADSLVAERKLIKEVLKAGGSSRLTEFPTSSHDAWTPAFQNFKLLDWLITNRRGEPSISKSVVSFYAPIDVRSPKIGWTPFFVLLEFIYLAFMAVVVGFVYIKVRCFLALALKGLQSRMY